MGNKNDEKRVAGTEVVEVEVLVEQWIETTIGEPTGAAPGARGAGGNRKSATKQIADDEPADDEDGEQDDGRWGMESAVKRGKPAWAALGESEQSDGGEEDEEESVGTPCSLKISVEESVDESLATASGALEAGDEAEGAARHEGCVEGVEDEVESGSGHEEEDDREPR